MFKRAPCSIGAKEDLQNNLCILSRPNNRRPVYNVPNLEKCIELLEQHPSQILSFKR